MQRMKSAALVCACLWASAHALFAATEAAKSVGYKLVARRQAGDRCDVTVNLEVGGEVTFPEKSGEEARKPISVSGRFAYQEQLLEWGLNPAQPSRSLRKYSTAQATIKVGGEEAKPAERRLAESRRLAVAELSTEGMAIAALAGPLTREQSELVDVPASTLAVDRLLPGREVKVGDSWDHDADTIGPLLGMDHVAVCEVRSVVSGEQNRQVQVRLAGSVQGTIEGAPTEMNLRAAYLYHLDKGRITKFNLAIEEKREGGEITPTGLDVVAKISLTATPATGGSAGAFDAATVKRAKDLDRSAIRRLAVDSPERGYRFLYNADWYVTREMREEMWLRLVRRGDFVAHCKIATHPERPADKPLTLQQFEADVTRTLGDKLKNIDGATEWTTATGCRCLGVIGVGAVDEVPIEWRYYQLSQPGKSQVIVSVTVEQSNVDALADAEKPLVESIALMPLPTANPKTEAKTEATAAKTTAPVKK